MVISLLNKWWLNYPWREVQTNLREIDMADMDAAEYVRQLKSFSATVAMINTAGIIASYPTDLDFHFQSRFLTGDSLEKVIAACHEAGIRVVARTDFSKVREPVYEQHPDWAFRDANGDIVNYNGDVHVCINSDYQQKYALEIMAEAVRKLDIDGMFFNMGGFVQRDYSYVYYGICHCDKCREKFAVYSGGLDLPAAATLDSPAGRAYRLFQRQVVGEQDKKVFGLLTSLKPDICISRIGDGGFCRQESNTALDRPLPRWQYDASENTKHVKSSFGPDMISSNTSVDFLDFPARHTAVSPYQQTLRLYQNLAQGGALDYYLIGRLDNHQDKSGFAGVQSVFRFHSEHEDVFRNDLVSNAKIALIKDPGGNQDEYRGWYRALAEGHFLFDTPLLHKLTDRAPTGSQPAGNEPAGKAPTESEPAVNAPIGKAPPANILDRYDVVILPDCEYLSDSQINALDAFVRAGGKLVGVYKTGFGDEKFVQRGKRAIHQCFGVKKTLVIRDDMRGSYFTIDPEQFPSLTDTRLIYLDDSYIYAEYDDSARVVGSLIPPQMFGPPERCYPKVFSDYPGAVLNAYGKGQTLFIPWKPGIFYYRQGYSVYLAYMADLLRQLSVNPLATNLPEMVEVTSHTAGDGSFELLSLVNNTGHYGLSFFAPVKLADCRVTVPVPAGRNVCKVKSLMLDRELDFILGDTSGGEGGGISNNSGSSCGKGSGGKGSGGKGGGSESNYRRLNITLPELAQYDALLIT